MSEFTLDIDHREGWPEHLRILADRYPRPTWEGHPNLDDLTDHWLHIHVGFRKALEMLTSETHSYLDRESDPRRLGSATSRLAGYLINGLHAHHQIEDSHFFPRLTRAEPRLSLGFETLEADHQALDGRLDGLTQTANSVLQSTTDPAGLFEHAGAMQELLGGFQRFLDRHLTDEEELIVPGILEYGARKVHGDLKDN